MIQTQLVFKNEYRFDLKKVESVIIPYLFNNDASLVISVDAKASKNYRSVGRIDQSLIDYPGKLIANSQVLNFGNQEIQFIQKGRFQLVFYPNYYLVRTTLKVYKLVEPPTDKVTYYNVQIFTESSILLADNPNRSGATILNKSNNILLIDFASEIENSMSAVEIAPGGYYEMPFHYKGIVCGRLISGTGFAVVREFN